MEQQHDTDGFAYFETPAFHQKMRALNTRMEQEGRMPADIGSSLGCKTEDFFAYLHAIKDDMGVAYVDVGGGADVMIDVGLTQAERLQHLVAPEHLAEAVELQTAFDEATEALASAKSGDDAIRTIAAITEAGNRIAQLIKSHRPTEPTTSA